eukprot:TRINITY_DN2157_c0_g1_i2.p1 TRINITY_DN2157_c0_g1~~TRINITY_DN2157_c0_g1_i2.p1  ORF type:complete len:789 (+),score=176.06 TRINITY_DN2157_c0_g1_i2:101-2368(+)
MDVEERTWEAARGNAPTSDPKDFVRASLSGGQERIAKDLLHLKRSIDLVRSELYEQIAARHKDLFRDLSSLDGTTAVVDSVHSNVSILMSELQRLEMILEGPFRSIREAHTELTNVIRTLRLLRRTLSFVQLLSNLKEVMKGDGKDPKGKKDYDLVHASFLCKEIDRNLQEEPLVTRIRCVDYARAFVIQCRNMLQTDAMVALRSGLEHGRAVDVGEALHCLFNLGQFRKAVDRFVENLKSTIQAAIHRSFLHPSAGAMRVPTHSRSGAMGIQSFFSEISECFDHINSIVRQGSLLDNVLLKRRDPHSHQLLLQDLSPSLLRSKRSIGMLLWDHVMDSLSDVVSKILALPQSQRSDHRDMLVDSFPSFLHCLGRLRLPTDSSEESTSSVGNVEIRKKVPPRTFLPLQSAFLRACRDNVYRLVEAMLEKSEMPAISHTSQLVKHIRIDIERCQDDPEILIEVVKSDASAVSRYISGCQDRIVAIAAEKISLVNNHTIQGVLSALASSLSDLIPQFLSGKFPGPAASLEQTIVQARGVEQSILGPIFQSLEKSMFPIFLGLHSERKRQFILGRVEKKMMYLSQEILRHFDRKSPVFVALSRTCAESILTSYLRQVSLLRISEEEDRIRIAGEMPQIEMLVSSAIYPTDQLDMIYRELREVRHMMFLSLEEMEKNSSVANGIRRSLFAFFLIGLSKHVPFPHVAKKQDPGSYASWLAELDEVQIMRAVVDHLKSLKLEGDALEDRNRILHILEPAWDA